MSYKLGDYTRYGPAPFLFVWKTKNQYQVFFLNRYRFAIPRKK